MEGGGGLTENADASHASSGDGGSQVKIDDVILEHKCWKSLQIILSIFNKIHILTIAVGGYDHKI